jgi:dienelactone hydrolase
MRAIALLALLWLLGCAQPPPPRLEGHWTGRVGDEQGETGIAFDFTSGPRGPAGTMSLPGRRLLGKALSDVRVDGDRVAFTLPAHDRLLRFEGRLDGDALQGNVAGIGRGYPLWLERTRATPPPYREQQVAFFGGDVRLGGSLLLPPGRGPFPAVILIHGSSTPDRNDFRYYADLYARAGIAALIYDKRPTGAETNGGTASLETLAGDVLAAAAMLEARPDIDRRRIGLFGFSQGGWVAPIAAVRHRFAFIAALSAPGVSYAEVTLYADAARMRAHRRPEAEIAEAMEAERRLDAFVRGGGRGGAAIQAMLDEARRTPWWGMTTLPAHAPSAAERARYLRWIDLDLDPLPYWRRLRLPVFIAYGDADENVPAGESARRIAAALGRAVTVRRYPGANHSLAPAPTLEADLIGWTRAALAPPPA